MKLSVPLTKASVLEAISFLEGYFRPWYQVPGSDQVSKGHGITIRALANKRSIEVSAHDLATGWERVYIFSVMRFLAIHFGRKGPQNRPFVLVDGRRQWVMPKTRRTVDVDKRFLTDGNGGFLDVEPVWDLVGVDALLTDPKIQDAWYSALHKLGPRPIADDDTAWSRSAAKLRKAIVGKFVKSRLRVIAKELTRLGRVVKVHQNYLSLTKRLHYVTTYLNDERIADRMHSALTY